jgi:LysR family nod box-dependent transcriptional activator
VVWNKNPLIGKRLNRRQFLGLGHVSVHFGHASAIFEDWFATRYGEIRKIEVVAQDFEAACRLVVGTNRIATVMSRMAQLCAEHLPLRLVQPPFALPTVTHCLQWHRYQDQDPGSIWLRSLLRQAADKLSPMSRLKSHPGP